jgi:hypothetical protein
MLLIYCKAAKIVFWKTSIEVEKEWRLCDQLKIEKSVFAVKLSIKQESDNLLTCILSIET